MAQVDRLSVALPLEMGGAVRDAAARAGVSVSAWVTAAAADRLRNELLGEALGTRHVVRLGMGQGDARDGAASLCSQIQG